MEGVLFDGKTVEERSKELMEEMEYKLKDPEYFKYLNECIEHFNSLNLPPDEYEDLDCVTALNMELAKLNLPNDTEAIVQYHLERLKKMPKINRQGDLWDSVLLISQNCLNGKRFEICVGDFLDEFYRVDIETKIEMLAERPLDVLPKKNMVFLGAMAHKLAVDYEFNPPDWVFEENFYLSEDEACYDFEIDDEFKEGCREESPLEFKIRNYFVTKYALFRV